MDTISMELLSGEIPFFSFEVLINFPSNSMWQFLFQVVSILQAALIEYWDAFTKIYEIGFNNHIHAFQLLHWLKFNYSQLEICWGYWPWKFYETKTRFRS